MNGVSSIYSFCSFYMVGVIWLIQLIHYPTFSKIEENVFRMFHREHTTAMSILVGPVMIMELITVFYLAKSFEARWLISAAMTVILWCLTFFVSVPIHNRLESGRQPELLKNLIMTNWPRTIVWTAKAALLLNIQVSGGTLT